MRKILSVAVLLLTPVLAMAHEFKVGDLIVDHPVAKATPATALSSAGYLSITNHGDTADSLIAVEAEFPRVELHDVKVENDIATMFHIDDAEIAPGETVHFAPGGKHIMFMGLDGNGLEEGQDINATLVFEHAGRLDVVFSVETLQHIMENAGGSDMEMDHSSHGDDHSNH